MELIHVKKGELIAKKRERVKEWYIIKEGTATLKYDFVEGKLGANSIIGILEQDWFLCDYIASTDCTLWVFPWNGVQDLKAFLAVEPKMRRIFLRTAMLQRHQLFGIYADFYNRIRQLQHFVDVTYNDYNFWCAKNKIETKSSLDIDQRKPLEMSHKAENWEINNSNSLVKNYLDEYLNLLEKDENLCVAAIMETAAQMRRVTRGLGEMVAYLRYNKELLLGEQKRDLFRALFDLEIKMKSAGCDVSEVSNRIAELFVLAQKLGIYDPAFIAAFREEYETSVDMVPVMDQNHIDDLAFILDYAGYKDEEHLELYKMISSYKRAAEAGPKDEEIYQLRKKLNVVFYDIYKRAFFHAMEDQTKVPIVMEMFFNFGYMGAGLISEERTDEFYELATHMDLCQSEHVFTIYEWLKAVYFGVKEPSKNEFDLDYNGYLMEQYKSGEIKKEEIEEKKEDYIAKTEFEIMNMFKTVNRLTYGNITMFCPVLTEADLFNSLDKMLVSADRVQEALDAIRKVDYSVFYREQTNTGLEDEMAHEVLMHEILPDVILMPNVGSRAMMWQETASIRNDTPARFILPIFTTVDVNELVLEITGRYRWEMCRKVQGVHWNDIRDKSLTSEYYDYLQFYRKNRELSAEVKEQIKGSLTRAKNNFREVFVRDYQNWVKYESKGGFRLNKYVRRIIFSYCPFSREIRDELKSNPMFADAITKHELEEKHTRRRLDGLYERYKQSGGEVTAVMKEHYDFYDM